LVVITVKKVKGKKLAEYRDTAEPIGVNPNGVTLVPNKTGGFQRVEVYIKEKMTRDDTRQALAHELFHCLQYLTECELDETNNYKIDDLIVDALVEKKKRRKA